jgi:hypothetical protein
MSRREMFFSVPLQTASANTWMTAATQLTMVKLNVATTSALPVPVNGLVINASETAVDRKLGAMARNVASVLRMRTRAPQMRTVVLTTVILELARARRVMPVPVLAVERMAEIGQVVENPS